MVQTVERAKGVIEIRPEEIEDFDLQVKRFQAGEWDETEFQAFRLKQGIYGQRQPDAQMVRVKVPFGGLTAEQMDALGEVIRPVRSAQQGTRHDPRERPDPPRQARGHAGADAAAWHGGADDAGGLRQHRPQRDRVPDGGCLRRRAVRRPHRTRLPTPATSSGTPTRRGCRGSSRRPSRAARVTAPITAIHDMGFIPKVEGGQRGFQVLTGGGTSIMPKLAPTLYDFVPEDEYLKVTEAVIRVFHRTDELRKNRMKARIKFYIARIGIDAFREQIDEELKEEWAQRSFDPTPLLFLEDESLDAPIAPAAGYHTNGHHADFQRWTESNVHLQKQAGYRVVTAKLPLGDINAEQWHELADLSRKYAGGRSRITHQQNIAFRWVPDTALYEVWEELGRIGFGGSGAHEITDVVSCPGTDSCKLGITASMGLGRAVEETVGELDLSDPLLRKMHVKMSGCPNGCGQHHVADIGFHGAASKAPGGQVPAYELFVGGSYDDGDARMGLRVRTKVPAKRVPEAVKTIIGFYQESRNDGGAVQGLRRQGWREVVRASVAGPERDRRAKQGYPGHVH